MCSDICRLAVVLITIITAVNAQYFGQNKVRYKTLDFKVLKTDHFDIYYYEEERDAAVQAGRMAERWFTRLSEILDFDLPAGQPVILYANSQDFRSTTVIPGEIGEGAGGVTEALKRRVVLPMAGALAETDHVLGHELVHAFQYAITTERGPGGVVPGVARLPLWFVEGMAEYLSLGPVDPHTAMWMRDALRRDEIPTVKKLDNPKYFPYRYGQAFWAYVAGRYGEEKIGQMLRSAGRSGNVEGTIQALLGVTADQLSQEWHAALAREYGPILESTLPPTEVGRPLVTSKRGGGDLNVSPALSPDGKWVVFFSERDPLSIDLYLADAQTGKIRRKITESAIDPHMDSLGFINSAGAWSADGTRFTYASISEGHPELFIYDVEHGDVRKKLSFRELGEILNPTWSPDGTQIAFSAMAGGFTDLFVADVETGKLQRLTNDAFAELQPAWSPDGTRIAFATDRFSSDLSTLAFGHYRLGMIDPRNGKIEPLPAFETGKNISPQWSPDSASLYFLSDQNGISNIYRLSRREGRIYQITNLQSGVSGITPLSPAFSTATRAERLVFSTFGDNKYDIYAVDTPQALSGRLPAQRVDREVVATLPPRQRVDNRVAALLERPRTGLAPSAGFRTMDYKPRLSLDYIAPPTISAGASEFGSFLGGGTALYFSDLLGYHNLMLSFETVSATDGNFLRNLSAIAGYQNQKSRWTWGFIGGQVPYLTGDYRSNVALVDGQPAVVEQSAFFWQIERQLAGVVSYPFNRAQRVEFSGGYRNVSFAGEGRITAFDPSGQLLFDDSQELDTPGALNMGTASTALVYDTSIFGGTSPVVGQRYRLELGGVAGSVTYTTALVDYRRYFRPVRPFTLAGRVLHFGRYGGGAQDPRLQDMFIGYQSLVRGYDPASFSVDECGPAIDETGRCPVFDRLLGSRIAVANVELRVPIFGALGAVRSPSAPPVEIAPFYDAGIAWTKTERANLFSGPRKPVTSYGASLRINLLGIAVGQISYVHPNNRPAKNWIWEFSLLPGF